jgi:hypothetical protein
MMKQNSYLFFKLCLEVSNDVQVELRLGYLPKN